MPKWKAHDRLEPLLRREGWSQARLAKALGMTSGAVSKWCSGDNDLGADVLTAICQTVGLSADEILGLDLSGAWPTHEVARLQRKVAAVRSAVREADGEAAVSRTR
jgi:transcriptional regulator with XRE-family HTH domain